MNTPKPLNTVSPESVRKTTILPAKCAIDLGDGSERGEYVDQDYILSRLGRPMRAINLMYCYYPNDKEWPARISEAYKDKDISYAWDYPYDDYFPYTGGLTKGGDKEVFECMKDIRKHGQDVLLTLTIDPKVSDRHLIAIAKDLRPFGRLLLRINHEATGDWFSFNKRATYAELGLFFAHCCEIFHREAPQIKLIICLDGYKSLKTEKMEKEDEFLPAIKAADIVSADRYLSLHWGWPLDVAEEGGRNFGHFKTRTIYSLTKKSAARYDRICRKHKPMVLSEMNADGDVTGPYEQCDMLREFCDMLKKDRTKWLSGFTLYQFRDRGRLGLETEDPNNKNIGIEQPLMKTFREIIKDPYFSPSFKSGAEVKLKKDGALSGAVKMRWGGSEDSDGIEMIYTVDKAPVFFECYFDDELKDKTLMLEINGRWFYKGAGVDFVDLMPAFFGDPSFVPGRIALRLFMTPADGLNSKKMGKSGGKNANDDWSVNQYYELPSLPIVRIGTEAL